MPSVQTWVAQKAASYLSKELHTNIRLKGLDIVFFKTIVLEDVLIEDLHTDTLLAVDKFKIDIGPIILDKNKFTLNAIILEKPIIRLKYYKNEKQSNLQFLLDYFSGTPDTATKTSKPIDLKIKKLIISNGDIVYNDANIPNEIPTVIDYDHIHVNNVDIELKAFSLWHGEIRTEIKNISLKEKSGFEIEKLTGNLKFTDQEIEVSNLLLITPYSNIHDYYSMRFDSLADFNDYINKVRMYADFSQSIISFKDIKYFASAVDKYTQVLMLNGKVNGTVANLQSKNIELYFGKSTKLKGEVSIKGLPDIYHTDFYAKLQKFSTNYDDVTNLLRGIDQDSSAAVIPVEVKNAGQIEYVGYYTGTVFNFNVNGQAKTDIGNLVSDFHMDIMPKVPTYEGTVQAIGFDLGKFLANDLLGPTTLTFKTSGKGFNIQDLKANIETDVKEIVVNKYAYKNIIGEGEISSKNFIGKVVINDEHIDLDFDGAVDFNDLKNPSFDFKADITHLDLRALNVTKDSLNIKSKLNVNFIGNSLDNIIGTLVFTESTIETKSNTSYTFHNINIDSKFNGDGKSLSLESDIIECGINGQYKLSTISSAVKSVVKRYLPSYNLGKIAKYDEQDFRFYIVVNNAKPITDLLFPELSISNKASLRGHLNTNENILQVSGGLDYLKYDYLKFENLIIDGENDKNVFDFNIASSKAYINDSININNIAISNAIKNDSIQFNIKLADKWSPNQLDLNGLFSISSKNPILNFLPSEILIDSQQWVLEDSFEVEFAENKKIYVSDFEIKNGNQLLSAKGVISKEFEDQLSIDFQNVSLKSFNQILKKYKVNIQGELNAQTKINGVLNESILLSNLYINNLIYNNDSIGNLQFNSTWDPKSELISLNGSIYNKRLKTFEVDGNISTSKSKNNLKIDVVMNETELSVVEPFVNEYVSNISGKASADLKIRGSLIEPSIDGYLTLKNAALKVNYLNTILNVSDQVRLSENKIFINNIQIRDSEGNRGSANGIITHTYFDKFNLDIKLQTKNMLCLNTNAKNGEMYYGKAYGTGEFVFRGPIEDIKIDINAKTERGTKFYIPLDEESSISKQNFIRFVNPDTLDDKKNDYHINLSGISMNMNLQVDEQSEVFLIMDPTTGETIKGTGNAELKLVINSLGTFEMYGTYEIAQGEYNFILQNLISKKFKVDKGGTIRWNGDPLKAKINLTAVYETRPQVMPLILSASPSDTNAYSSTQRVKAECVMYMRNELMSPDISFGLRFPEDQNLLTKVGGYLANTDNLNNQVASLLVFGRFSNTGTNGSSFIPTTGFLTSQLSSLVSTKNFDLNLANGVGGSLRLFNDRITIDGSLNTASNSTSSTTQTANASSITGDVNIDYKISKDGRFRAKGFQRNDNNSDVLKRGTTQLEQGVGLFYRIEFDTFGELMRKIFKKNN